MADGNSDCAEQRSNGRSLLANGKKLFFFLYNFYRRIIVSDTFYNGYRPT